jgi:hypothetical protein
MTWRLKQNICEALYISETNTPVYDTQVQASPELFPIWMQICMIYANTCP